MNHEMYEKGAHGSSAVMEAITAKKHWEASDFTKILCSLATLPGAPKIPGANRPDSIDLHSWVRPINQLWELTAQTGREHGRVVFADAGSSGLVMGKTISGTETGIALVPEKQRGREHLQRMVATIHTHPNGERGIGKVFSGMDFLSFMSNADEQAMCAVYDSHTALLVLKTSATPTLSPQSLQRRIHETVTDFHGPGAMHQQVKGAIDFNKMICTELGLTLYRMTPENGRFMRIEVTR